VRTGELPTQDRRPAEQLTVNVDDGASRYQTLVAVAPWAFSEAMAGCYPARELVEALRTAYHARFGPEDGERLGRIAAEFLPRRDVVSLLPVRLRSGNLLGAHRVSTCHR
jgi:hypothetical protein